MSNPGILDDEQLDDDVDATDAEADRIAALETEARRQGWRPQEEYRGPAGQWRSAEDFLKRGQDILPMVRKDLLKERERANNMEKEIAALRVHSDEQKAVMEDLLKMARNANEAGYKRAIDELKAQQRQAAQQGDITAVVELGDKISEVQEERARAETPKQVAPKEIAPVPKPRVEVAPEVEAFVEENPWFNSDPELHRAMEMEHMLLLRDAPGMALEENLRQAKEAVMARFPKKFGITPRRQDDDDSQQERPRRSTSVSPPSAPAGGGRERKTGIASIENVQERQMAQQAFNRAKRLMPAITETEWFQIYQDPHADVIEMIDSGKKKGK